MEILAAIALVAWLYLCFGHGRFWTTSERLEDAAPDPDVWPEVVAIVPARDEADVVERSIGSLLAQDYPGRLSVILVDDESRDATAARALDAAKASAAGDRLRVCATRARPPGWVGKMWAVHTGIEVARESAPRAAYVLLTDADVEHGLRNLARLVRHAERSELDLVSLMVKLDAQRGWSRLLIPAFVHFFALLYPFPRVNDPRSRTAAAAGGCMLLRRRALERIGGVEPLRGEVIDDCALARAVKRGGAIWLGLSTTERSLRPYDGLGGIWDMVARSAYTQLDHRPSVVFGTILGLGLLFAVPVAAALGGAVDGAAGTALLGVAAWALMACTFLPTVMLYHRGASAPLWALALPAAGVLYGAMTLDSALRHHRGRGAQWKGRVGAGASRSEGA
jgi:hopene-associated glycosyltransferase HpnB